MAGRTLYCQRCGYHQFVGAAAFRSGLFWFLTSEVQPCFECGGTTFHPDHPSQRDRLWRPPAFSGEDRQFVRQLRISPE